MSIHVEYMKEQDRSAKLYTAAENLWQTLNALHLLIGEQLDDATRNQIKDSLKINNPSNYSA